VRWETVNGAVNLTQYFSSRWPYNEQIALIRSDFDAYVRALPPFFVDMIQADLDKARAAADPVTTAESFIDLFNLKRFVNRSRAQLDR
jgi:hypothetical protein